MGGRSFNPELADPSEAGALAAALWELQLLVHHYHPHVAQVRVGGFGAGVRARAERTFGFAGKVLLPVHRYCVHAVQASMMGACALTCFCAHTRTHCPGCSHHFTAHRRRHTYTCTRASTH